MPDSTDRTKATTTPEVNTGSNKLSEAAADSVGPQLPNRAQEGQRLEKVGALPSLKIEGAAVAAPKLGAEVQYKGEKLNFVGEVGGHALLHKTGRNMNYASICEQVTQAELKARFDKVTTIIDGAEKVRYVEKKAPREGVYFAIPKADGSVLLWTDPAFEVVAKETITTGAKTVTDKQGKPPALEPTGLKPPPPPVEATPAAARSDGHHSPDVPVRDAKWRDGSAAEERARTVDGTEVKVRTPKDGMPWREVEVGGNTVRLQRRGGQQWFYSEGGNPTNGQVKLHITGVSENDLARLHKELLPLLEEMRARGDVELYKTFDPNFIDGKWKNSKENHSSTPGPLGQNSKAFTVYVPPHKAQEVAAAIDKHLKEKGLVLEGHKGDVVGERTRQRSDSKRVSVERDHWTLTSNGISDGALLDEALSRRIREKYAKSHGTTPEGRLTPAGLAAAEKAAGIEKGQLSYDKDGRLMFDDANYGSDRASERRFYADEHRAVKEKGKLTGRPALYALYEAEGLDPAKIHTDEVKATREVAASKPDRPRDRVVPTAEPLVAGDTRATRDGTLERRELRPGEALARETLERRDKVDPREIEALRRQAEKLAKSDNEIERRQADALKDIVSSLEGKNGPHAQEVAHRKVIAEAQRAAERGTGGYGKAIAGGMIGLGILVGAALAAYRSTHAERTERLNRAKVTK
ncbi:MAG: hypothetical protein K2W95_24900 [Candidatus Obscuribacterales bacterium]|nr:hypothetical protein [Candidatus Obscuribacterales bacterium]